MELPHSAIPVKVVVIGPESTGKSTLCKDLALYYQTLWCPEFARDYLARQGKKYAYADLLEIAKGQVTLENEYITQWQQKTTPAKGIRPPLFIDTNMYVMKVWCEYVFGNCHQWIIDQIVERDYDLYLLCNIDLPWVRDDLREYPDLKSRKELFEMYKDIMANQSVPWKIISGTNEERLQAAIHAVENSLQEINSKALL
jgi:NadR type nicotinamide-nucleotide adenylyltransferase